MSIQTIVTPGGDEMVVLSRREFDDLIDARDHAAAMRDVSAGTMPVLEEGEMDAYLAAATPLAFWRKRAGMTQAALAAKAGLSQPYLAQMETGQRTGDVDTHARLARALGVRIEDLLSR